jgi:hypothetical protein
VATTATETVTAKAVNDPPTLSGIKSSQTTVDYVAIKPFAAVTVADVDKPDGAGVTDSIAIRVLNGAGAATDANGKLSAGTLPAGTTFTETQPGVYTLTAPDPAALTQAFDGLTFTPTQAEVNATASSGNDLFVFSAASGLSDAISGFTETNGDVLDLRAALAATTWNHTSSTLANYLKVTDGGGNTNLAIAPKGSGAGIGIAILTQTNFHLADLVSHHSLLT